MRIREQVRPTSVTMAAVLGAFAGAAALQAVAHLQVGVVVLAVTLAVTLSRSRRPAGPRQRLVRLVTLPVIAVVAGGVAQLLAHHPDVGDPLFVLAVSGAIWLRRYGELGRTVGSLITLPFIAILITPLPQLGAAGHDDHPSQLWAAVVALLAAVCVEVARSVDQKLTGGPAPEPAVAAPVVRASRGLPASTRMAAQMAVALALAFLVGRELFPGHWSWMVITAYIVNSGNRGRGDVAYKSVLRLAGAAGGTVVATLLAGALPVGDRTSIVLVFAVLAIATLLRPLSYAFWAAGITAILSLLNGYYGRSGTDVLLERLGAVALGAVVGLAAAWFILPVRTTGVVRRRVADVLAVLGDYLAAARTDPATLPAQQRRVDAALDQLALVAAPIRAHRQLPRAIRDHSGTDRPHLDDAVTPLLACRGSTRALTAALTADPPERIDPRALGQLQRRIGMTRRAMAGREVDELAAGPQVPLLEPVDRAVRAVARVLAPGLRSS